MKKYMLFAIVIFFAAENYAQQATSNLQQFYFMNGTWKGRGWVLNGSTKEHFNETETIRIKLSGTAIQMEAYGVSAEDPAKVINDALGILKYNSTKKQHELNIYQSDGSFAVADVQLLQPGELEWGLTISSSLKIKYIIRVTGNKWYEAGYRSTNNGTDWKQTFEMDLEKMDTGSGN